MGLGLSSLPLGARVLRALLFLGLCLGKYLINKSVNHKEKW